MKLKVYIFEYPGHVNVVLATAPGRAFYGSTKEEAFERLREWVRGQLTETGLKSITEEEIEVLDG